jgi:hypothetical protein
MLLYSFILAILHLLSSYFEYMKYFTSYIQRMLLSSFYTCYFDLLSSCIEYVICFTSYM